MGGVGRVACQGFLVRDPSMGISGLFSVVNLFSLRRTGLLFSLIFCVFHLLFMRFESRFSDAGIEVFQ